MKTLISTALAAALALTAASAKAEDRIVILPDKMPETKAREVLPQAKRLMAKMELGDSLIFLNGPTGELIAELILPEGKEGEEKISSRRKRAEFFGAPLKQVQDFIVKSAKMGETIADGEVPMQVNMPGVLHGLTIHADKNPNVFVFGTLRFQDDRLPDYSMATSFPNDAHVVHTPGQTPFGAKGRDGYLTGTKVHFCDLDQGYVKDIQRLGLERATGLLVQGYGATMANVSQDINQCVTSGLAGKVDPTKAFVADPSSKGVIVYDALKTATKPDTTQQEQSDLFNRINLPHEDKEKLKHLMTQKRVTLAEVYLYDTAATDGDVVALMSGPVSFEVHLTTRPQQVIVPITDNVLKMRGVRDGRGGITVGVKTKKNEVITSPVMRVGQVIDLPFLTVR